MHGQDESRDTVESMSTQVGREAREDITDRKVEESNTTKTVFPWSCRVSFSQLDTIGIQSTRYLNYYLERSLLYIHMYLQVCA